MKNQPTIPLRGLRHSMHHRLTVALACAGLSLLSACGNGGSSPPPPPTVPPGAVTPVAPSISTQPANASVNVGTTATFTVVVAGGTGPITYQWRRNGIAIVGATSATYTTAATVIGDSGAVFGVDVVNPAGTLPSAAATLTVVAISKAWGTAAAIEAPVTTPRGASGPHIAFDGNGNALAVWLEGNGNLFHIWANRYTAGTGWGSATQVDLGSVADARDPQIAVDAGGNAIAVWQQQDITNGVGNSNIYASRYVVGVGWGVPVLIEFLNDTGNSDRFAAYNPQISIDASGNALAVWAQSNSSGAVHIWSNLYVVGAGWGAPTLVHAVNTGTGNSRPQIAIDASGNAIAVWMQYDPALNIGARDSIWANRYAAGTGWGGATQLDVGAAAIPRIAMNAAGSAFVVWKNSDGTRDNIWANRYVVGVGWGTRMLIETDNSASADVPQIAIDPGGNAIAAWAQGSLMRTNRYVVGTGWGPGEDAGVGGSPHVAIDANGSALLVFQSSGVSAKRYVVGAGWGAATNIETPHANGSFAPQVAFDVSGNALAVWAKSDGTRISIWANQFR